MINKGYHWQVAILQNYKLTYNYLSIYVQTLLKAIQNYMRIVLVIKIMPRYICKTYEKKFSWAISSQSSLLILLKNQTTSYVLLIILDTTKL